MKNVCVIGPESTGKTNLCQYLARQFQTIWVPEYAREYLNSLSRPYVQQDLSHIAVGQARLETKAQKNARSVLFCDTNLLVIKVWSLYKYGSCNEAIVALYNQRQYDLYLLTDIDIPWVDDPQRENPHDREQLFEIYKTEVQATSVPWCMVSGSRQHRERKAMEAVKAIL